MKHFAKLGSLNNLFGLGIFYILGFVGFFIFKKLKAPSPAILGSILFLGIASLLEIPIMTPSMLKPVLSIFLGIIVGLRFNNIRIKGLIGLIILIAVWLTILTIFASRVLVMLGMDIMTALFSASPGGITEIIIMSMSFDADSFAVAMLQISRMLLTISIIPFIVRLVEKKEIGIRNTVTSADNGEKQPISRSKVIIEWSILIALAVALSWLFQIIGIPAPQLLGSMVIAGIYTKIRRSKLTVNPNVQSILQIGVGGLVGLSVARENIINLPLYITPIIVLNLILFTSCGILAFILYKITSWDLSTCLLSVAPGGMNPLILLSIEMKADTRIVTVFQVLRMFMVLLLTPLVGRLLV